MNATLDREIKRLRRRVRLLLAERYGLFGGSIGALAAVVLVVLSSRYDDLISYWLWFGTVLLGTAVGCAYGLIKRLEDLTVAAAADKRTGLQERLSSAIAVSGDEEMAEALVEDASGHIAGLRSAEVFRRRFGAPHIAFAAAMLTLLAAIIVPQLDMFHSRPRKLEVAVMKTEGEKLVKLGKELKKSTEPKREQLRKLADKLEKLGKKMQTGRMAKKQAMLKVQRLNKEIQKQQNKLAKENSQAKPMRQAQVEMKNAAEELAKKMGENAPSDKRLTELARKQGPLTPSERQELEQQLQKYADASSKVPVPKELGEALLKLAQNSDYQKAAALMQQLAQKLNSGKMGKMDKKMLQQQMQMLAKALKNTDLDKLSQAMLKNAEKLAKMSPQELAKLAQQMKKMQQMAQALKHAGAG